MIAGRLWIIAAENIHDPEGTTYSTLSTFEKVPAVPRFNIQFLSKNLLPHTNALLNRTMKKERIENHEASFLFFSFKRHDSPFNRV